MLQLIFYHLQGTYFMWIEVFKTGRHTDSAGNTKEYNAGSLDAIAYAYNSRTESSDAFLAPIVKGHPKTDSPAYGWVARLARRNDTLLAKVKDMNAEFAEEIRRGRYKKVSIALYPDMLLRHVGFLGAASPAVKGLQPVQFSDISEYSEVELEGSQFSEAERENMELREQIEGLELNMRRREFAAFAESLTDINQGLKINPAHRTVVEDLLELVFQYDKKHETDLLEHTRNMFSSIKPDKVDIEFDFTKPYKDEFDDSDVLPERLNLHRQAKALQSKDASLSYEEAVILSATNYTF
jgi:hypothetical protein